MTLNRICPRCGQLVGERDDVTVAAVWGPDLTHTVHWQHIACPPERRTADPPMIPTHVVGRSGDGFPEWLMKTYDDPMSLPTQEVDRLLRAWDAGWRPERV
jgi:hypothetical protein